MKRPERTREQSLAKLKRTRAKLFYRSVYKINNPKDFVSSMQKAHLTFGRLVVQQALGEMGIKDKEIEKKLCVEMLKAKEPGAKLFSDVMGKTREQVAREARIEQSFAAKREAACKILGKKKGEEFWEKYKKIREER